VGAGVSEENEGAATGPGGHKRKSWPAWRVVLADFVIVVLGVGVALAAQQAAEWWHWRSEVTAARTALRAEMVPIADYYGMRVAIAPCVNRKLEAVSAMIADAAAGRKVETGDIIFNGLGAPIYDSEWQSQRASQTLTHFPRQELALMSTFYGQRKAMEDWSLEEAAAWAHLAVLQDEAQKLGSDDLAQLRVASHMARRYQNVITLNAERQLDVAARLGIRAAALTPAQIANRCNRPTSQIRS
jgi:hypothetical protein